MTESQHATPKSNPNTAAPAAIQYAYITDSFKRCAENASPGQETRKTYASVTAIIDDFNQKLEEAGYNDSLDYNSKIAIIRQALDTYAENPNRGHVETLVQFGLRGPETMFPDFYDAQSFQDSSKALRAHWKALDTAGLNIKKPYPRPIHQDATLTNVVPLQQAAQIPKATLQQG